MQTTRRSFTITTGFPPEAYDIRYPTQGKQQTLSPVSERLLVKVDSIHIWITVEVLDHGVFIPLKLMYPEGGIPVTQLSLLNNLDPSSHLELGKALKPLLERKHTHHRIRIFIPQYEIVYNV